MQLPHTAYLNGEYRDEGDGNLEVFLQASSEDGISSSSNRLKGAPTSAPPRALHQQPSGVVGGERPRSIQACTGAQGKSDRFMQPGTLNQ
jgi:hypothetical protein